MANDQPTPTDAARVTYRFLRVGLVGAVVLVAISILLEHFDRTPDCFQYSASAYYYTPVRTIFVGALFAIGIALIAIKGNDAWEDCSLTFAGALAIVVAIIPTTNVNPHCPLTAVDRAPVAHEELRPWVVTAVDNNMNALLITAGLGLVCGVVFVAWRYVRSKQLGVAPKGPSPDAEYTLVGTAVFFALLLIGYFGFRDWFYTHTHALSAALMVAFIGVAVGRNVWQHRPKSGDENLAYFWIYLVVLALMIVSAIVAFAASGNWNHWVLGIETLELLWIGVFWVAQTKEHWSKDSKLT